MPALVTGMYLLIMLTASLKALSKKAKPGPCALVNGYVTRTGSRLFTRQLYCFSLSARVDCEPDIKVHEKVMKITEDFLRSTGSKKMHRLDAESTFAMLGLDSIDKIDLVIEIEEKLGIDITNHEAENIRSVSDAITLFTQHLRQRRTSNLSSGRNSLKKIKLR